MEKYQFDPVELHLMERSSIPLAIYQFIDRRVVTLVLSDGLCKLLGCDREQAYYLMDHDMYRDTHPDDVARVADAAYRFATQGGDYNVVYRTRTDEGYMIVHAYGEHRYVKPDVRIAVVWYSIEGRYQPDASSSQLLGLDLAYSTALHKESAFQTSSYDQLTGLPNMSYFFSLAQAGMARMKSEGKQTALVFFDLNGMKYYNSQHGFAEGNKLIIAFARVLGQHFSSENCGNFGGDHFAVYTEEAGLEDTLQQIFAETEQLNGGNSLSVRVGVYLDRMGQVEVSVACDRAKYACDTNQGYVSGFRYFDESMLHHAQRQSYITQNLDRAIREQWIQVYYQPIIRASNGRVCNEEALCRWFDPVEGYLSPGDLIPVLEEVKLAYKLDLYVVDRVLEKMKRQKEAGLYLVPQSVNLSRTDFDACDIVEEIRRRVDAAGVPRDALNIEITESAIGSDFDFMREQIDRFRALGFRVWMDDFGSGYSSLDVLQSVHFDLVKFDMRFMQQLHDGKNASIILTELTKMVQALDIDTVAEGVETFEQVEFLRDIGCNKLQGYYYCPAVTFEQIVERNQKGKQIGYENPAEADYYAALGQINLYNLSFVANHSGSQKHHLFDTLPMVIIEANEERFRFIRGNKAYRGMLEKAAPFLELGRWTPFSEVASGTGASFARALRQCREEGSYLLCDEEMADGSTVHVAIRHVAVNPVTKVYACVAAMLGISYASERRLTYTSVAQALSADYINLYYVNLETTRFIEYTSKPDHAELGAERNGTDFFNVARCDALSTLHPEDVGPFLAAFTRENILKTIDENGAFTLTYRLMKDGDLRYVSMKAVRIGADSKHIIIGVNNVDAQMRQQQTLERARRERMAYHRIAALSGKYLCIYTVDPKTDRFSVYTATEDYARLPIPTLGEDFFNESVKNSEIAVCPEDRKFFQTSIAKENMLREIRENGIFSIAYRMILDGQPRRVRVKAALIEEENDQLLIVGVKDIDDEIER